jgi:hypothetical protein
VSIPLADDSVVSQSGLRRDFLPDFKFSVWIWFLTDCTLPFERMPSGVKFFLKIKRLFFVEFYSKKHSKNVQINLLNYSFFSVALREQKLRKNFLMVLDFISATVHDE